jgi:hypothetical protein
MTSRCGPLVVAIASAAARISGDYGAADVLAVAYLAALTFSLSRASELHDAARVAHSCAQLQPVRNDSAAYSIAR